MNTIREISEINSVYGACSCLDKENVMNFRARFKGGHSFVATSDNDPCEKQCCAKKDIYAYVKQVNVDMRSDYYLRFKGDFNGMSNAGYKGVDYYVHSYFTYCKSIESFFRHSE